MADARTLTLSLRGKWYRRYGVAPCPVCQPEGRREQNALTLADGDGTLLLHCKKSGCVFRDILAAAGVTPGDYASPDPATLAKREAERQVEAAKREKQARSTWAGAQLIEGTLAETYLRARGITCDLPETLRFHPACWHASACYLPAMVARIDGAGGFAVHRTYLRADGMGKAAVEPAKAMLGSVAGRAVRLAEGPSRLVVAEGIETALSLACGLLREPATIWAALSASGMAGLRLPEMPGRLTVATDGDAAGREAGYRLAERAAVLGWQVDILPAPEGRDWNDILTLKGGAA